MHLIELNNIGKIYVTGETVAVGIRGVDLSFDRGEFVAVTGASGSGKSTLLNIIAGMDSYEEGEMFIEGKATSHYSQSDWEEFRRKYISFVFQDYQIIESFTVLQNVELALTDINDPKLRRAKAMELIEKVGLTPYIKHKGSHLSGGQKQRTVIARALAKDSPVILADEPTGNLDSETSKEIIKLLREVSADKLLIVVTHSIEEVAECATREIVIDDGKVVNDRALREKAAVAADTATPGKAPADTFRSGMRLGSCIFSSKPASSLVTVLLLLVVVSSCFFSFGFFGAQIREILHTGDMFTYRKGRVVAIKRDSSPVTDEEVKAAESKYKAIGSEHPDILIDTPSDSLYWYSYSEIDEKDGVNSPWQLPVNILTDKGTPDIGRYPEKDGECFIYAPVAYKDIISTGEVMVWGYSFKLTGAKFFLDNNIKGQFLVNQSDYNALMNINMVGDTMVSGSISNSKGEAVELDPLIKVNRTFFEDGNNDKAVLHIPSSSNVDPKDIKDASFTLMKVSYGSSEKLFDLPADKVEYVVDEKTDKAFFSFGRDLYKDELADYRNKDYGQFSLLFNNDEEAAAAADKMNADGYLALLSDSKTSLIDQESYILMLFLVTVFVIIIAGTVFIMITILYFATGRTIDYLKHDISIMRSMGITPGTVKTAVYTRMFISLLISLISLAVYGLAIYRLPEFNRKLMYLHPSHYLLIILFMTAVSVIVAHLHIRRLFSDSVKKNLREA